MKQQRVPNWYFFYKETVEKKKKETKKKTEQGGYSIGQVSPRVCAFIG